MAILTSPTMVSFLRHAMNNTRPIQLTFSEISDTNIKSSSSFLYDHSQAPLKNTQQLNIDWSKFENHTFFSSAEAKVNLSFDQIINGYPFDGSKKDVEVFFEKLTGFDKYVFDQFPKYRGQLLFSGTQIGEDDDGTLGTWILTKDHAGFLYPEISKNQSGESILNPPQNKSFTFEAHIFIPEIVNDTQVIFQKISSASDGISLYLLPSALTASVTTRFSVISGSNNLYVDATLEKGKFNHICVTINKDYGLHYLQYFVDSTLVSVSRDKFNFGKLNIDNSDLLIGSGSKITYNATDYTPTQTFSGSMDELRIFHSSRTTLQQSLFAQKAIYSTSDLKLYYKFNEPVGPLSTVTGDLINGVVLDSSGNSLHSLISNFTSSLRQDVSDDASSLMIYEKLVTSPILFPAYSDVVTLNTTLLVSASLYDSINPNLITKLVPQHYLLDGALNDGFEEIKGQSGDAYTGNTGPGSGVMGNVQIILSFLYIWARFFDEMKLFVDSFSTLKTIDYETNDTIPNNFLNDFVKRYGFNLPPLFNDSTIEQYVDGENIEQEISTGEFPIKYIQNELLRRVLVNMPGILKSKGTQHSIKAFLRSIGIDPENSLKLREFGGPTTRQLSFARETRREPSTMVKFISSSFAVSNFLSASRVEPGYPNVVGPMVDGKSTTASDGLLTSGSWTIEGVYKFPPQQRLLMTSVSQSLMRLSTTGSSTANTNLVTNVLAISSSVNPRLVAYLRSGVAGSSPLLQLELALPKYGIFDGDRWSVSFGCMRNDSIESNVSSSYFLRASHQGDDQGRFYVTSSYFQEAPLGEANVLQTISAQLNQSGAFLELGNRTFNNGSAAGYLLLNNSSAVPGEARTTNFEGWVSGLRFWSRGIQEIEWKEHVRNYKSLGVQDPLVNYNFVTTRSGSFEKIRLDTMNKQSNRRAVASASLGVLGSMAFLDFSLNNNHISGTGFPIDSDCLVGETFDYSYLSPSFDEASTDQKIRIRSFQDQKLIDNTPWAGVAPIHEIVKSEQPTDDVRFSIEFSLIDSLNKDIITMFSTFDAIDNALGNPELLYSQDYPDLERLRNVYFNRISSKINFRDFFEFFRWFDTSIGTFIEQLIPRKTNFKGVNFVIESHMLERHKLEYHSNEIYLMDNSRDRIRDVLLVQQLAGNVRKY